MFIINTQKNVEFLGSSPLGFIPDLTVIRISLAYIEVKLSKGVGSRKVRNLIKNMVRTF